MYTQQKLAITFNDRINTVSLGTKKGEIIRCKEEVEGGRHYIKDVLPNGDVICFSFLIHFVRPLNAEYTYVQGIRINAGAGYRQYPERSMELMNNYLNEHFTFEVGNISNLEVGVFEVGAYLREHIFSNTNFQMMAPLHIEVREAPEDIEPTMILDLASGEILKGKYYTADGDLLMEIDRDVNIMKMAVEFAKNDMRATFYLKEGELAYVKATE